MLLRPAHSRCDVVINAPVVVATTVVFIVSIISLKEQAEEDKRYAYC